MKPQPTKKQQAVLDFIVSTITKTGKPPSYRTIGRRFGINVNAVTGHVESLEKKGLLSRVDGRLRV